MKLISRYFVVVSLLSLLGGLSLGILTGIQFLYPQFLSNTLPFQQMRPLHVSFVIWWIFLGAAGGIYFLVGELREDEYVCVNKEWIQSERASTLARLHLGLWLLSGFAIAFCLMKGIFGGREYLTYPPILSAPILLGWIIFAYNTYKSIGCFNKESPVFVWMWITSLGVFTYTFLEAHLWIFPWFGSNIIRDITVQWKSYGALVASWNMLLYGTAMCVMYLTSKNRDLVYGKLPFALYFLGLTNSYFNWGHHTYTLPAASWIRDVSYFISMTELLILGRIIWTWSTNWREGKSRTHLRTYCFLMAADVWILLNLALALALSIPALNVFVHGTHVVVAHSMGATIGINSMILLASLYYMLQCQNDKLCNANCKVFNFGFFGLQSSFFVFWVALLGAGVIKAVSLAKNPYLPYRVILAEIRPAVITFVGAGSLLFISFLILILPLLNRYMKILEIESEQSDSATQAPVVL